MVVKEAPSPLLAQGSSSRSISLPEGIQCSDQNVAAEAHEGKPFFLPPVWPIRTRHGPYNSVSGVKL